jgi:type IV pilus assembly protein PilA
MTERKKIFIGIAVTMAVLLLLAIVIPNLQRSRMSGPSTPGVSILRTLNLSQIVYSTTYPDQGYASNLAVLGSEVPDFTPCHPTQTHACLMDAKTACPSGIGTAWCVNGLYRYNIQSSSTEPPYRNYWITATPVQANPKFRNYCSLSDAVIRSEQGTPLDRPYTLEECHSLAADK